MKRVTIYNIHSICYERFQLQFRVFSCYWIIISIHLLYIVNTEMQQRHCSKQKMSLYSKLLLIYLTFHNSSVHSQF